MAGPKKTPKQIIADFAKKPADSDAKTALRVLLFPPDRGGQEIVCIFIDDSNPTASKLDVNDTFDAYEFFLEANEPVNGALTFEQAMRRLAPSLSVDPLSRVKLFKGKSNDQYKADWGSVAPERVEIAAYAGYLRDEKHEPLAAGTSDVAVHALKQPTLAPPWSTLEGRWADIKQRAARKDRTAQAVVDTVLDRLTTSSRPFVGDVAEPRPAAPSIVTGSTVAAGNIVAAYGDAPPLSPTGVVRVLIVADRADASSVEELRKHMTPMERAGRVSVQSIFEVPFGVRIDEARAQMDRNAEIVLLMLSANLSYEEQVRAATLRGMGKRVIPVLLAPCLWRDSPIGSCAPLPPDGVPIKSRSSQGEAWVEVVSSVRRLADEMRR